MQAEQERRRAIMITAGRAGEETGNNDHRRLSRRGET
jgi:hypothetical protein